MNRRPALRALACTGNTEFPNTRFAKLQTRFAKFQTRFAKFQTRFAKFQTRFANLGQAVGKAGLSLQIIADKWLMTQQPTRAANSRGASTS